ncbi:MAG: glutamate-5-semialdehyde dehydrogenase, partial [Yoonia sp.]
MNSIKDMMHSIGVNARTAATILAATPSAAKQKALEAAADAVWAQRDHIIT